MTDTAVKLSTMLEIHRYFAGDQLGAIPAKLTDEQKRRYGIAQFRKDWEALSDTDKQQIKVGLSNGSFTY